MITPWKTLSQKEVFATPWFRIYQHQIELPSGKKYDNYYIREQNDAVSVFGVTKKQEVILLKEYKYGVNTTIINIPTGIVEKSDVSLENAALREFEEETGYTSQTLEYLGSFWLDPTSSRSKIHLFIAKDCYPNGSQKLDETETIDVFLKPLSQVKDLFQQEKTSSIVTLAKVFLAVEFLQKTDMKK